jgi:Tol biopolymer transport system component
MTGKRTRVLADVNPIDPRFSVDGKKLTFFTVDQQTRNGDVWVTELTRGASSRITFAPALDIRPVWSPLGDSIIFQSNRSGIYDLYIKNTNGSGEERLLVKSNRNKGVTEWSLDGRYVTFLSTGYPKTKVDLWILPMTGERNPVPILQTEFNEGQGSFSPDSRWIVYASDETGKNEIYARHVDGTGGKIQITTNGGRRPQWRSDPRKIYYSSLDRKLQIAYVSVTPASLSVDSIRTLYDYESRGILGNTVSDVSYDGKQVAAIITESKQAAAPITLIINWDEEMKKK